MKTATLKKPKKEVHTFGQPITDLKSKKILFVDFETRSKADLKTVGAYLYAYHESTSIIFASFRLSTWAPGRVEFWFPGQKIPSALAQNFDLIVAHNFKFEYYLLKRFFIEPGHLDKKFLKFENYDCTMAKALRWGFPGKLEELSFILKLKTGKLKTGKRLIEKYSKPNRKTGEFLAIDGSDLEEFKIYGKNDVLASEEIFYLLPEFELSEREIFIADAYVNARGFLTDQKNVEIAQKIYERELEKLHPLAERLGGKEDSGTLTISSTQGFKRLLGTLGVRVKNVQARTLKKVKLKLISRQTELSRQKSLSAKEKALYEKIESLVDLLDLRENLASRAATKFQAFKTFTDLLGIARDQLQYGFAHTLRWAGRGIQPQNLVREAYAPKEFLEALKKLLNSPEIFKPYCKDKKKQNSVDQNEALKTPIKELGRLLRGLIVPRKSKVFAVGDLSAIEARFAFWLAGCKKALDVYRQGKDIYVWFAAKLFNIPEDQVSKLQRSICKVAILGLQYGMGHDRFFEYAIDNGVNITYSEAGSIRDFYLATFPEIPAYWKEIENLYKKAMLSRGKIFSHGPVSAVYSGRSLKVKMPSGRSMYYIDPEFNGNQLSYRRGKFWGGVILENLASGGSRDLLAAAFVKAETESKLLEPVLTIHDEILAECLKKDSKKALKELEALLTYVPSWAPDLPLAAECAIINRYGKI